MFRSLIFWKGWSSVEKAVFLIVSFAALSTILGALIWYYGGDKNALNWDIATELKSKVIQQHVLTMGGLDFSLPETLYYVKEYYIPSSYQLSLFSSWFLLIGLGLGMTLLVSGLSNQRGILFLSLVVLTGAFFLLMRLENVFNTTSQWPFLLGFGLVAGLAYYYSAFRRFTPFIKRLFAFLILGLLISIGIYFTSAIKEPVFALSSYGILFGVIASMIFIFWVAQELYLGVIWLIGQAAIKGTSSFTPFVIFSVLYILNSLLVYLENTGYVDNSFFIVSPFFALVFSAILGLWSLKKFLDDVPVVSFQGTGLWVFLGFAIISFASIGYAFATGNDSLTEFFGDYIAAVNLVVAICLFIHALVNYSALFKNGYNVSLVFWKPKMSKLTLARVGAILLTMFLLSQRNFYAFDQVMAGAQNAQADYFIVTGQDSAAESYFKESTNYDLYNHKANYGLATLATKVNDRVSSSFYYKQANFKKGSEFAYVGLSQNLESETLFFDAIFTLQEGLQKFPNSAPLATNLARLMDKAQQQDSSFIYTDNALAKCYDCKVELTNIRAFWLENGLKEKVYEQLKMLDMIDYESSQANQLAIDRWVQDSTSIDISSFSLPLNLNVAQFANLFNATKLGLSTPDSTLTKMQQQGSNQMFAKDITYLRAINAYKNGNKVDGFKKLSYLAVDTTAESIIYRKQLAIWYLQEGLFERAVNFFESTGDLATVNALQSEDFKTMLRNRAEVQALRASSEELSLENYKTVLEQAPFNPYLLKVISDFLVKKDKSLEAYKLLLSATEFNDRSPEIWKNYSLLALQNGVSDYAEEGLNKVKQLVSPQEFNLFLGEYMSAKEKLGGDF